MRGKILILDLDSRQASAIESAVERLPFDVLRPDDPDAVQRWLKGDRVDILVGGAAAPPKGHGQRIIHIEKEEVCACLDASNGADGSGKRGDLHALLAGAAQRVALRFAALVFGAPQNDDNVPDSSPRRRIDATPAVLSQRETEVATLLAQRYGTMAVARKLGISVFTVRNHIKAVYDKLAIHSRDELIVELGKKCTIAEGEPVGAMEQVSSRLEPNPSLRTKRTAAARR